jgi:hypothetical protein
MIDPGTLDLLVLRNAPRPIVIQFRGYDFTAATFALQVRSRRGATGDPLISLTNQTAGTQGLSVVVTEDAAGTDVSDLTIQIDEATIDALLPAASNGQKAGTDVVLAWDLIITGGGLGKVRWLEGKFIIREGVTV